MMYLKTIIYLNLCLISLGLEFAQAQAYWSETPMVPTDSQKALINESPFERVAEIVKSAVITIHVKNIKSFKNPLNDLVEKESEGSGFIFHQNGFALSNYHVVENAKDITITLYQGKQCTAEIIGVDPALDIAVLKLNLPPPIASLPFGNSDLLRIGEWVMAVGNPLGLSHSITVGIVSAKGRQDFQLEKQNRFSNYIQTDASINPGNSGGPLVNQLGQVVGVNTAMSAKGQGIGFAIPINMIKKVLGDLIQKGYVRRSWLGVHVQDLSREELKQIKSTETQYAKVSTIIPGSPADLAGIEEGDIITHFNQTQIKSSGDLSWLVSIAGVEKEVLIKVLRKDKGIDMKVKLGLLQTTQDLLPRQNQLAIKNGMKPMGENAWQTQSTEQSSGKTQNQKNNNAQILPNNFHGLYLSPLLKAQVQRLRIQSGVYVTAVYPESVADKAGVMRGDVILSFNDQDFKDVLDLQQKMAKESKLFRLKINRGGKIKFIAFALPSFLNSLP